MFAMPAAPSGVNAVIYARYSSHGQNEQTIEGQLRVCKEYARERKLNVIATYVDKHKTGTDVNRPQFQKMITDSATGTFQYVIVYMIDRFARNRYYSTMYNFQLAQNGVRLVSAMENISESEEGEFYQMFLEWQAERYSKRLSARILDGLTTSVNNGTCTGGRVNFGYKVKDKRVYIDDDTAPIVQYIFTEYAKGVSKKDIAAALNAQGSRYNGREWRGRDFDHILANRKYTGAYLCGGRECLHTFPQIIDAATFDRVQVIAQKNKLASGASSAKVDYLLQGKLYCGHCGARMHADGGTGKSGKKFYYYACSKRKKYRACDKSNEQKDFLEWYAVEQVVNYLSDPRRVRVIADDIVKYYESRTSATEIKRLTTQRVKVQKDIDNAVNLLVSGVSPEVVKTLDAKIVELTAMLNDLSKHIAALELEAGLHLTQNDIVEFVTEFIRGDLHDKAFQKRIIDNLINAMYISDDRVVLYFNINNGCEESYIGKDDTDAAIDGLFDELPDPPPDGDCGANAGACVRVKGVQTLTPTLHHKRQCLNTDKIRYIFVKGVAGIVIIKEKRNH